MSAMLLPAIYGLHHTGRDKGFDLVACGIATYYLIDRSAGSVMSKFTKKVLQHGMMYAFGTTCEFISW
ncbi:hypothetical protein FRC10_010986 [Ceratobasidium sp. 414]|nr:hypothetical protein FRC10_010986 [Ceratobasidium sp. 414]